MGMALLKGDYCIKGIYLQFESIDFLYGAPLEKVIANITYWYADTKNTAVFS